MKPKAAARLQTGTGVIPSLMSQRRDRLSAPVGIHAHVKNRESSRKTRGLPGVGQKSRVLSKTRELPGVGQKEKVAPLENSGVPRIRPSTDGYDPVGVKPLTDAPPSVKPFTPTHPPSV